MKIQVGCLWNLDKLENLLHDYKDKETVTFLKYSWPISHNGETGSTDIPTNWPGAFQNKSDVSQYFDKELPNKAVLGPFQENPFGNKAYLLPLNMRDKKDSLEKRIIMDMSFPKGNSINDGIDKDTYLDEQISLKYPTVCKLVEIVKRKGKGCMLFK